MTATPTPLRELERDPRDFANEGNPTRCAAVWNEALLAGAEAAIAPLVEFFRAEGYQRFGWDGDVRGWTPVQTAIAAMRAALSARDAAGAGVQICTFADCTCDALHTTTSGEPIDHATPTPLRELHRRFLSDTSQLPDEWSDWRAEFASDLLNVIRGMSARDEAGAVVAWRVARVPGCEWHDGAPSAQTVADYAALGITIQYAYGATPPASGEAGAVRDVLAGRPLYLFGREHFDDKQKAMAEIEFAQEFGDYVVFCMKDVNAKVPPPPADWKPTTLCYETVGDAMRVSMSEADFNELRRLAAVAPAGMVPVPEVHAWIEARREYRRLVEVHNARVRYARTQEFGAVDCNHEYQMMCKQERAMREAAEAAGRALEAAAPTPPATAGQE